MIDAPAFVEHLHGLGYSQYAGVPCSFFTSLLNCVINHPAADYVGAASEGEAVGITLGAFLAGRKTVTMCQNSGLGNMVNPLTSLNYPFRVPTLLIVTWRGQPGVKDEPQHEQMGRIMHQLLDTLEIPWLPFPQTNDQIAEVMTRADATMLDRQRPFALILPKDRITEHALERHRAPARVDSDLQQHFSANERLTRTEALELILETLDGNEAIIATTGKTGRELFTIADRPNHLYVVGGMGTASAIGFGVAHSLPQQPVVVIDGDGAALMKMGSLATIGFYQPEKFLHIVLDNEVHDSTGGQQTASPVVRFAEIAAAANYRACFAVDGRDDIRSGLARFARSRPGPCCCTSRFDPVRPGAGPSHGETARGEGTVFVASCGQARRLSK